MSKSQTTAVCKNESCLFSKTLTQSIGIGVFILLTALGAQLEIQRYPVPYTLQTWFVLMAGALLGKRNGAISMLLYIILGTVGVPVFSQWGYGLSRIIGPTGGYLLSFPVAAFIIGYLVENNKSIFRLTISMVVGMIIIYMMGTIHLHLFYLQSWSDAITQGLIIFAWWDGLKILTAVGIVHEIKRRV